MDAIEQGTRLGLSRKQMLQEAAQKAAELNLQASRLQQEGGEENANRAERQSNESAANALRTAALKQAGVLGTQKLDNQALALGQRGDALDAREALDQAKAEALQRHKPIFSNTGGGLMQFNEDTGQWQKVAGSSKPPTPEYQTTSTKYPAVPATDAVPADVTSHWIRNLNPFGPHIPDTTNSPAIPAQPAQPERTVSSRVPINAADSLNQGGGGNSLLALPPSAPQIPQGAIDFLNANPHMAGDFQNKYGVDPSQYLTNAATAAPSPSDVDSE